MTVRMRSSADGNMKSCKTPSPEASAAVPGRQWRPAGRGYHERARRLNAC